jgi:hypothetical protein
LIIEIINAIENESTHTEKYNTHITMLRVMFKPMIAVFERSKALYALDPLECAATLCVGGGYSNTLTVVKLYSFEWQGGIE